MNSRVTGDVPAGAAVPPSLRSANSGQEQRWRSELERAHGEQQVAAMHSVAVEGRSPLGEARMMLDATSPALGFPRQPAAGVQEAHSLVQPLAVDQRSAAAGAKSPANSVAANAERLSAMAASPGPRQAPPTPKPARSLAMPAEVRALLDRSGKAAAVRMNVLVEGEQDAHIVIREDGLSAAEMLRSLADFRRALAREGYQLVKLTLNGELLWQGSGAVDNASGQLINRVY